jgi:hypothetical protein
VKEKSRQKKKKKKKKKKLSSKRSSREGAKNGEIRRKNSRAKNFTLIMLMIRSIDLQGSFFADDS